MPASKNIQAAMPRDRDNAPVQVLTPDTITNAAVGGSSVATALPAGAEVVEVVSSTDCWVKFGTSGVSVASTSGMYLAAGATAVWRIPENATHLAHIQASSGGRISITKLV